eukprot:COSAG06_NODE_15729_length_1049_cov_60.909474_2_plen_123_part_00
MISIYCIEDINNIKYVGSTKKKLKYRLSSHLYDKKRNNNCSSKNLDLENCKIYELEKCQESNRRQREQYWIDNTKCVNQYSTIFNMKQRNKYVKQRYKYQSSWGGDRQLHNNLLQIDLSLFD